VIQRDPHAPSSSTTPSLREARQIMRFFLSHSSRPCTGFKTDLLIFNEWRSRALCTPISERSQRDFSAIAMQTGSSTAMRSLLDPAQQPWAPNITMMHGK
jgi:hypothetical protein